jgi:hypothetical protein
MAAAFDSLRYTQRLEEVGVSHDVAVRHAELARDMIIADLVTKDDLTTFKAEIKAEINAELATTKYEMVRTFILVQAGAVAVMLVGLFFK